MPRVYSQTKQIVGFIFVKDNAENYTPNGTAFFVSIPDESREDGVFVYIVTAKHVLVDKQTGKYYDTVYIRLNRRDEATASLLEVPLVGDPSVPIFTHDDETVDIAVLQLLPPQGKFDFKTMPEEGIVNEKKFKDMDIQEGDDVFFTGLFRPFFGTEMNYPILRFGKVAMISDEKIPWYNEKTKQNELLDLYLLETQSFGGNSGSPVFFYFGPTRDPGYMRAGEQALLAGVMKGSFQEAKTIKIAETGSTPFSVENAGIAAVVPAFYLRNILYSDRARQHRQAIIDARDNAD